MEVLHMSIPILVRDVMSHPAATISPTTTVAQAAAIIREQAVDAIVVVENETPIGLVTKDDLIAHLGSAEEPHRDVVSDIMHQPVASIEADARVNEAMERLAGDVPRCLVVVANGTPVGVVTPDDISHYLPQIVQRHELTQEVMNEPRYRFIQDMAYESTDWSFESICLDDEEVNVGDRVTFSKRISEADVRTFAAISGDTNRLHLDDEYAEATRFGRRIVHGTLIGGLISAALARLPGVTIYISQDLTFLGPIDIGDELTAICEVVESLGDNKFELTTDIVNAQGETVLEGQAAVLVDASPEISSPVSEAIEAI